MVIIAASGMAEAGRILHHLAHGASDPRNTILIVGFQAEHTLGRRIVEHAPMMRVFGDEVPLRARVEVLDGYSAHGDRHELQQWLDTVRADGRSTSQGGPAPDVYLVHGEPEAQDAFAEQLRAGGYPSVRAPTPHQKITAVMERPTPSMSTDARARIVRAGTRCITREGVAGASMAAIAEEAGVSKALLHYHYHDRATLLAEIAERIGLDVVERERAAVDESGGTGGLDALWRWLDDELRRGELAALATLSLTRLGTSPARDAYGRIGAPSQRSAHDQAPVYASWI